MLFKQNVIKMKCHQNKMSLKQNVMPVAGILSGALVWGLIWYPYRMLQEGGFPGPQATLISYLFALLGVTLFLPRAWRELPGLGWWGILLLLSAGWANLGYVLAMLHGEVMRVLLLFYLAPVWTILFSYWLLSEQLNRYGYLVIALSLGGAFVMLWEPRMGIPLPQNVSEWIGLSAGMSFAFSNVVSRRAAHLSVSVKSYCVLLGTALLTVPIIGSQGGAAWQVMTAQAWLLLAVLGLVLCATSFAVQYGVAQLAANRAVVLFLFELVVAAASSYVLAGEAMTMRDWLGGLLIITASLLSGNLHVGGQHSHERK
ncbi:MAG: DMT family transporter [Nitrosomonadales bacterium]|nr:DMT family transporter [Nitrosomonadales bacterium]